MPEGGLSMLSMTYQVAQARQAELGQPGGATATPAGGGPGVEVGGEHRPADERPGLLGVPAPVAAPGRLGPDGPGDDGEGPDGEAEGGRPVGQLVEGVGRREPVPDAAVAGDRPPGARPRGGGGPARGPGRRGG